MSRTSLCPVAQSISIGIRDTGDHNEATNYIACNSLVRDVICAHVEQAHQRLRQAQRLAAARRATVLRSLLDFAGDEQDLSQAAARAGTDLSAVPGDAGAVGARWRLRIGDRRASVPGFRHVNAASQAYRGARPDQPPP